MTAVENNPTWSKALESGCKRNYDEAKILAPMNDLIARIVNAIIRQEGMNPTFKNPGNLRGAPWYPSPIIVNGFWVPPSRAAGVAGVAHVVALRIAEGESLSALISAWAPSSDGNDTAAYIANVKEWASIPDATVPLWNFIGA